MIIDYIGLKEMKIEKKMRNYLKKLDLRRQKKKLIYMIRKIDLLILLMFQEIQQDYSMIKMIE